MLTIDEVVSQSSSCERDLSAHGESHEDMKIWMDRGVGEMIPSVLMMGDHDTDADHTIRCDWRHQSILSNIGERASALDVSVMYQLFFSAWSRFDVAFEMCASAVRWQAHISDPACSGWTAVPQSVPNQGLGKIDTNSQIFTYLGLDHVYC